MARTKSNRTMNQYSLIIHAFATSTWSACGSTPYTKVGSHTPFVAHNTAANATEGMAYACPRHPADTEKKGDKCTKRGMDLHPV